MNRVISVKPLNNFMLELIFADGLRKIVDIRPFISKGVSAALQDETIFVRSPSKVAAELPGPTATTFAPTFYMTKYQPFLW